MNIGPPGRAKCVDAGVGHDLEGKRKAARCGLLRNHQPLADGIHICRESGVLDDGYLLAHLRGGFLSELNVLLLGEQIEAGLNLCRPLRQDRHGTQDKHNGCEFRKTVHE